MSYLNDQWAHYLTREQVELLLKRVHPNRVNMRDGFAYMEAHDIKAELTRIFGFGRFSSCVTEQVLLFDDPTKTNAGKDAWYVGYRSRVRLKIYAPDGTFLAEFEEGHAGDSTHPVRGEAHGNAITNSESYALKRCATFLGDQFGASLYNKGSREALVRWTLVMPPAADEVSAATPNTDDVPVVHPESEQVEPALDNHVQSQPPAETPEDQREERVKELRGKFLNGGGKSEISMASGLMLRDGLGGALTDDGEGNVCTLAALADQALKRVTARARAAS